MAIGSGFGALYDTIPTEVIGSGFGALFDALPGQVVGSGFGAQYTEGDWEVVDMVVLDDTHFRTPLGTGETVNSCRILRGLSGGNFTIKSASGSYLYLGSKGELIPLNDASNLSLTGYTAASIIGALNEIKSATVDIVTKLASLTGVSAVDLTTTGSTALYTVPTGKSAVITDVLLRVSSASAANGDAEVQVEITGSSGDVIPSTTLVGATAAGDVFRLGPQAGGSFRVGVATNIIYLNVTSAETGTTLDVEVDVFGYTF